MSKQQESGTSVPNVVGGWSGYASLLCAAFTLVSTAFLYNACVAVPPVPHWTGPLGKWIDVGFERVRLRELDNMNLFSRDEFDVEDNKLLDEERLILCSFPKDYREYTERYHEQVASHRDGSTAGIWSSLAVWVVSATATGLFVGLCWHHDRRVVIHIRHLLVESSPNDVGPSSNS